MEHQEHEQYSDEEHHRKPEPAMGAGALDRVANAEHGVIVAVEVPQDCCELRLELPRARPQLAR